jgi:hypothetical protein
MLADAGVNAPSPRSGTWIRRGAGLAAATAVALGIAFWVAANWGTVPRVAQVLLLQGLVAIPAALAIRFPRVSAPLGLVSLGAVAGLFGYLSQTLQTGRSGWQILAWWAVLCLALCLALRRDVVWVAWGLGATWAVGWWLLGRLDSVGQFPERTPVGWWQGAAVGYLVAVAWLVLALLIVGPWARGMTGAGGYALRATGIAALAVVVLGSLVAPGAFGAPFYLGAGLLVACCALLYRRQWFDATLISASALGLCLLLDWWLIEKASLDDAGEFLLIGLFSGGLLAGAATLVVHRLREIARRGLGPASRPAEGGTQ